MTEHALTISEAIAGQGGGLSDTIASIVAQTVTSSGDDAPVDLLIGGVDEGFAAERSLLSPKDSFEAAAFRRAGPTRVPATFRSSFLQTAAQWPTEKRSRLILAMQKAGILSEDLPTRYWLPEMTTSLEAALTFANINGITDPFEAVGVFGGVITDAERRATPKFKPAPYLAPDYDTLAQDVKSYVRQRLGREPDGYEVEQLTAAWSGFDRMAYERDQELEQLQFEQASDPTSSGGGTVTGVAPGARFAELFEKKYRNELDFVDDKQDAQVSRAVVDGGVGTLSQMSGGR